MRVARIELRAYGHFADFALDFDAAPGLHLVYGDNEAGKSTTLRALSSLLFGYPHLAEDAFRHQPRDIALAGRLVRGDGGVLDIVRRRGRNGLVAASGAALSEAAIGALLGGVGRELFERVFALDHRRLREHARSLLADGGALGAALAEAGAGFVGLKAKLDELRGQREALFVERGQRTINQQIARLADLHKRARQLMVSPESYGRLHQAVAEASARLDAHRERRRTVEREAVRLERLLRNLPRVAARRELLLAREALGDAPLLAEGAPEERARAETARDDAQRRLAEAAAESAALRDEITAIALDEVALGRAEEIAQLAERRGKVLAESDDLPRREASLRERSDIVSALLRDAGLAAGSLDALAPLPQRQHVRRLAQKGAELTARLQERRHASEQARARLAAAEAQLAAAPAPPDVAPLADAVAAATRLGEVGELIGNRRRATERAAEALAVRVMKLGLADGAIPSLRAVPLPSATAAQNAASRLDDLAAAMTRLEAELAQIDDDVATTARELSAFAATGSPPTEEQIAAMRDARDRGWALIRGIHLEKREDLTTAAVEYAGTLPLPDAFAARLSAADRLVDIARRDGERAARHAELLRRSGDLATRAATLHERRARAEQQRRAGVAEWESLWARSGLAPLPAAAACDWLAAAALILADAPSVEAATEEIVALEATVHAARERLVGAIMAHGKTVPATESFAAVLARARALLDHAGRLIALFDKLGLTAAEARRGASEADRLLGEQQGMLGAWRRDWTVATTAIGLAPNAAPEEADDFLQIIAKLDEQRGAIAELRHRIDTMRQNRAAFDGFVADLATSLLPQETFPDMVGVSRALERHGETAAANARRRAELGARLAAAAGREAEARRRILDAEAALTRLCARAGGVRPDELPAIEARSAEQRKISAALVGVEREIIADGGGRSLAIIMEDCAGADCDGTRAALTDAQGAVQQLETHEPGLTRELARLEHELEDRLEHDQSATLGQEAALEEAALAEEVEHYVGLAVEELLLRRAVELYRERNQDPILARASQIFAALTEGAYAALRTDLDGKGMPVVLALDAQGATREVEALSDGTLDQLYLALRLAVIHEHNAGHEPVPFIADDLLVNFDDRRAIAALRVLAGEVETTQVLLFTHHAHLAALARRAVPDALIEHRLPRAAALAA